ncbi:hypothetical protein D3C84_639390 [compost metagenome]
MGNDGFANVGLPDPHHAGAVVGDADRIHQSGVNGEGTGGGGEVAAVAAPVHEGLVDGDLAVEVVHVVIGLLALGEDHALAGGGGGAPHAVHVGRVGVRAADDAQEECIPSRSGLLAAFGQIR